MEEEEVFGHEGARRRTKAHEGAHMPSRTSEKSRFWRFKIERRNALLCREARSDTREMGETHDFAV